MTSVGVPAPRRPAMATRPGPKSLSRRTLHRLAAWLDHDRVRVAQVLEGVSSVRCPAGAGRSLLVEHVDDAGHSLRSGGQRIRCPLRRQRGAGRSRVRSRGRLAQNAAGADLLSSSWRWWLLAIQRSSSKNGTRCHAERGESAMVCARYSPPAPRDGAACPARGRDGWTGNLYTSAVLGMRLTLRRIRLIAPRTSAEGDGAHDPRMRPSRGRTRSVEDHLAVHQRTRSTAWEVDPGSRATAAHVSVPAGPSPTAPRLHRLSFTRRLIGTRDRVHSMRVPSPSLGHTPGELKEKSCGVPGKDPAVVAGTMRRLTSPVPPATPPLRRH